MILPMSSACSGQFLRASPRGMIEQFNRAPPLRVSIRGAAGVEKSLGLGRNAGSQQGMQKNQLQDKIRKQLREVQLSPSSYDTAWVAMVPVQGSHQTPRFPQCIEWILQNQHDDGSWGINLPGSVVNKDILLCTLACVVALKRWNTGRDHISRGLNFIGKNFWVAMDEQTIAPVGFNITFSGLLNLATGTGLEFPVMQTDIDGIFHMRKIELERDAYGIASSRRAFMAYVSEGLGSLQDWDQVMAYQRKNRSIFNSPSATAATVIHGHNDSAHCYLDSLVSKLDGPVPVMYPQNAYSQLCMVDTLEKMGISNNFSCEIRDILDMIYRLWIHNEEELMLDMGTCAMAFRLLRMHGYDISSDGMAQFVEQSSFDDSIHGYLNDTKALLELYRSSQIRCLEDDLILQDIGSWSARVLQEKISSKMIHKSEMLEVEYALKFPVYATLERLEQKRNIEQFKTKEQLKIEGFKLLKSGYRGAITNDEILALAVDEFHSSQSVYQQELQDLNSWVAQTRLDELKFARLMPSITYFSAAATMFPSELSEARIAWTQNCILTTTVDDFFDGEGSKEEMENLVKLIEKWDGHGEIGFSSECVEILFYAIYNTSKQIAEKAVPLQKRNVVDHIAESWWFTVRGMLTEAEWRMDKYVPTTVEEYMSAAVDSFALGPIITSAALFVGPELSEEVFRSKEYIHLMNLANTIGRLLNDMQTYEKEIKMGKVNSVMLHALSHSGGGRGSPEASMEEAKREMRGVLQGSRCDLLRLVTRDGGIVPPPCRKLFWFMSKVLHFVYMEKDGYFTADGMMASANAVILDPLQVTLLPSGLGTL
ncbi:ent-pimara-8(14),15-diene synthase isoform X1 [Oryza glaberrima]|uniref:ent-pimara-8(14),15-diene synthase isoform X1 n=3 Tax=Oryza glaberrima TaxID=4538 RepID=UPI00224BFA2C|nr:ent-pimara-8(14),15-diene synthase isoform X1 [Oryza glaberrima]XP_052141624.1 ent-pimara-8(14),15-diene synthase isoform X1 [Oryza glaberrima]